MAWKMDKAHSSIEFVVRHMMISKVRGQFTDFDGTFELNEDHPEQSKVEVTINASSITTRNEQRDTHLKSGDFLDVEKYPHITFKSNQVEVTGKQTALLKGDLTVRGKSRPVVVQVEYIGHARSPYGTESYGFTGDTTFNRKDWNLTWNVALETGGVLVGDEVNVHIELEVMKVSEEEKQAAAD